MRKFTKIILTLAMLAAMTLTTGCAGKLYGDVKTLSNGREAVMVGRTGIFGADAVAIQIVPKKDEQPQIVTLKKKYTKSMTSWTGCKDENPNKNAKNIRRFKSEENWQEEVLGAQEETFSYATGNPSAGNSALGSAFMAAGIVGGAAALRPSTTSISGVSEAGSASSSSSAAETGGTAIRIRNRN